MSNSNLDKPYIQIHKSMTCKMKEATNIGLATRPPKDNWRHPKDGLFSPVILDDTDTTGEIYCKRIATADKDKPVIGVLGESFRHENVSHKLIIQGVVPMLHWDAGTTAIKPGDYISAMASSEADQPYGAVHVASVGEWIFGIALTGSYGTTYTSKSQEWISVLLIQGFKKA